MGVATIYSKILAHFSPGCEIILCLLRCGYYLRAASIRERRLIDHNYTVFALWAKNRLPVLHSCMCGATCTVPINNVRRSSNDRSTVRAFAFRSRRNGARTETERNKAKNGTERKRCVKRCCATGRACALRYIRNYET